MSIQRFELNSQEKGNYINKTLDSKQFQTIKSAIEQKELTLKLRKQNAIRLRDEKTGESRIRVDFLYKAVSNNDGDEYDVNIQTFYVEHGDPETTGYLRVGNILLEEYYTNDDLIQDDDFRIIKWDGDVILDEREFEKDGLLD